MKPARKPLANERLATRANGGEILFALACGCWIGVALLKFGNPVIFDGMITAPSNLPELIFTPWPVSWGYLMLLPLVALALKAGKLTLQRPPWPIAALAVWFLWQILSHAQSVDRNLSLATVVHFGACLVSFALGRWCLGRVQPGGWFWAPVILAFGYVLISGFDQHYGGLESTRKAFYEQPNWQLYPKEYLLKIQSNRIFSTLVYPNALAGVILLLLPVLLFQWWQIAGRLPRVLRAVGLGMIAYMGAACLYWTGSKGGWLVALLMLLVLFLHLRLPPKVKVTIMTLSLVFGLLFFFLRFSGYFQKGATSVSARFTYWDAAVKTALAHPLFGTGPGTFSIPFKQIKAPEAEMAKLTHNDFLEQASDSGLTGALTFGAFVFGSIFVLYRKRPPGDWGFLLIWLGLLGWTGQAFIEFGLYVPAIAWPVFLFFGFLWAQAEKANVVEIR